MDGNICQQGLPGVIDVRAEADGDVDLFQLGGCRRVGGRILKRCFKVGVLAEVRGQDLVDSAFAIHLMGNRPDFVPCVVVIHRFRRAEVIGVDVEYAEGVVDDRQRDMLLLPTLLPNNSPFFILSLI